MATRSMPDSLLDDYARAARNALDRALASAAEGESQKARHWLRTVNENVHAIVMEVSTIEETKKSSR